MHYSKSFWLGIGVAGAVWLWRRQLRPLAVKGVKGGLLVTEGVKDNVKSMKNFVCNPQQDPETKGDMD